MLRDVRRAGLRIVVTLHTVRSYGTWDGTALMDAIRGLSHVVIVHTRQAQAAVGLANGAGRVVLFPHGTRPATAPGEAEEGYDYFELEPALRDPAVVKALAFGFLGPGKNLEGTIRTLAEAKARRLVKNCVLLICGESKDENFTLYTLPWLIANTGLARTILYRPGFVRAEQVRHIMAAADFGILNTWGTDLSASGQVHVYAGHRVPLAVANRPIYTDAIRYGAIPFTVALDSPTGPTMDAINAVAALAQSSVLREQVRTDLDRLVVDTEWGKLVREYYEPLYRSILEEK